LSTEFSRGKAAGQTYRDPSYYLHSELVHNNIEQALLPLHLLPGDVETEPLHAPRLENKWSIPTPRTGDEVWCTPWICVDQLLQDGTRDRHIRVSEDLDDFVDEDSVKI
jgi:hypothetical protein